MAQKVKAAMPPNLDLGPNYIVKLRCVDPTTGADVAGVKVANFSILCTNLGGGNLQSGSFLLVPGPGA